MANIEDRQGCPLARLAWAQPTECQVWTDLQGPLIGLRPEIWAQLMIGLDFTVAY